MNDNTPSDVGCDVPVSSASCGIRELTKKVDRLTCVVEEMCRGVNFEYYADIAKQLISVPSTLGNVEKLLKAVLADRAEEHEKMRQLELAVRKIENRVSTLELLHGNDESNNGNGASL